MPTLSLLPGTRPFACGNSQLVLQPAASLAIPTMSSLSPSPPTTVKSSRALATAQSSYGILWATANLPSPTRATRNGFHAFASAQILRTPSLLALAGTSSSRYVGLLRGEGRTLSEDALQSTSICYFRAFEQ